MCRKKGILAQFNRGGGCGNWFCGVGFGVRKGIETFDFGDLRMRKGMEPFKFGGLRVRM